MYGDFPISEAFAKADDVLTTAAKGIAEIITVPGYINVDFADVETVMRKSGVALMGTGIAEGDGRALTAVEAALNSPLLNNNDIRGAKNILLNVTSGNSEITMDEIGEISDYIQDKAGYEADLIWGNGVDETLGNRISVTVIATGFSISAIPEMMMTKKTEKQQHFLNEVFQEIKPHKKNSAAYDDDETPRQGSFQFGGAPVEEDLEDFNSLYPEPEPETRPDESNKRVVVDFADLDDNFVDEMEGTPAFVRKQMDPGKKSFRPKFSSLFVSESKNKQGVEVRNNKYLHEKPD
jgi:cell division protein FtsZ